MTVFDGDDPALPDENIARTSNQRLECITLPNNSVVIDGTAYDHLAQVAQENVNLRAQLSCATAELAWAEECGRKRDAGETASPQMPIARVIVREDEPPGLQMYAPGLPPGAHELYCEPEAVAPYMRAAKAVETAARCLVANCTKPPMPGAFCEEHNATVGSICGTAEALQPAEKASELPNIDNKDISTWCGVPGPATCRKARAHEGPHGYFMNGTLWEWCSPEKTDDHRYIEALEGQLDSVGLAAAQREAGITADVSAHNVKGELREDWPLDASGFPDPRNGE